MWLLQYVFACVCDFGAAVMDGDLFTLGEETGWGLINKFRHSF